MSGSPTSLSTPATMLSVTTHPTPSLHTTISSMAIPTPRPNEVLIKVHVASSNPKDWSFPMSQNKSLNSGDDLAGTISALGASVPEIRPDLGIGSRVAAFHVMGSPFGAYAEYAIAPAHTVFRIPDEMSFEEASTIPLVSLTAAISLFRRQGFEAPWNSHLKSEKTETGPLIIYGASSALGTYASKLAMLAGIHPLVAIGGGSGDYVKKFLETNKADVFIDYRDGIDETKRKVAEALGPLKAKHALDAISSKGSWIPLAQMLDAESRRSKLSVVSGANRYNDPDIPHGVEVIYTYVGSAHEGKYLEGMPKKPPVDEAEGDIEFARQFYHWVEQMLKEGKFEGHPFDVIPGGLEGVETGLLKLKNGEARGKKFVYQVAQVA